MTHGLHGKEAQTEEKGLAKPPPEILDGQVSK